MVTKSPKKQILGKRQFKKKNTNLRVHVQKLDENVYEAYRNRLIGMYGNSTSVKEERSCIFASEIDLNDNEHAPNESGVPCQCNYCSPCHEMKWQSYKEYLDTTEDQENVDNTYPYLCNLIQESVEPYPYSCNEAQDLQAPAAVEKCDASTQTDPRQYKFTCKDCFSQFNNQYYYEQHISTHVIRLYECAFCNATFDNEKQMQSHILLHKYKNVFECVECSCAFSNKKHLMKHVSSHNKNFFECGECKAQFNTDKGLQNHKKTHVSSGKMIHVFRLAKVVPQSEPPHEVAVIETESANLYEELQSNAPRFFECTACHLQFSNASNFARHNVIHNRSAAKFLHFCSVCGARFRANNHLVCHKRHAHKL